MSSDALLRRASIAVIVVAGLLLSGTAAGNGWRDKVESTVLAQMDAQLGSSSEVVLGGSAPPDGAPQRIEFFVFLGEQADLSAAIAVEDRVSRGSWVMERLVAVADRTQAPIIAVVRERGMEHRAYWVANMVWTKGDASDIEMLAQRPEVARILGNPRVAMSAPVPIPEAEPLALEGVESSLTLVRAPDVWALGITGQGAVLASADTGVQWDHPALKNQYGGWDGVVANHNYSWHDAIHSGGGSCGADSPAPCDDQSHGTHTVGTMVGDDGGTNQVGMAPDATWIACRNMDQGFGTPASYSECFQWFIAPTDLNDENPDPSRAPHAINNSWSCPASEGCVDPLILKTVVENTRAAGIVVVVSAGNSGPSCSTVSTPTAIYDASFTVGATTSSDVIAGFSARGPVTVDGSNRLKPDISAPGVGIRSSVPTNGYGSKNGTSMASPHAAGLMALLVSANPVLAGRPESLETLVESHAVPLFSSQGCGGDDPDAAPNHVYGHGRIDALGSVEAGMVVVVPGLSIPGFAVLVALLALLGRAGAGRASTVRKKTGVRTSSTCSR